MSKNGKVKNFVSAITRSGGPALTIPEEALPSEEMLDRQLEAVTISESEHSGIVKLQIARGPILCSKMIVEEACMWKR